MRLRPESWVEIASADDTRSALGGLMTLGEINRGESSLADAGFGDLSENAPDLIADWVVTLNAWRMSTASRGPLGNADTACSKGRAQRTLPVRLRQEVQEMLRPQLNACNTRPAR